MLRGNSPEKILWSRKLLPQDRDTTASTNGEWCLSLYLASQPEPVFRQKYQKS